MNEEMVDFVLGDGGHDETVKRYAPACDFESHRLWSGRYLKDDPDILRKVLQDTLSSGTRILLTYTYQTSVDNLQQHYNITKKEALDIIKSSVSLCREAIELARAAGMTRPIDVFGMVGPYGAFLHDGSEYAGGNYADNMTGQQLADWHRPRFDALIEAGCDYLIFATIPSLKEAEALISLLKEHPGMKAIVSFSAQNELTISHGEKLSDVAQSCWQLASDQILAIGVNCLHPRLVEPLLRSVKEANPQIPLSVKTNTTETFNTETKQWESSGDPKTLAEYCRDWLHLGVKYISGCCRTSVQDIITLGEEINKFIEKTK
ncbi:homocysteine S-methyltransferase YbgG-like [Macrosteles quadrilineatus]|uniref:homocysteine S-methyltransferase YbgG-like n=1 Tax=Macrosteles quadrilineatus TaxID=74068 RepID=UPI0023E239C8|nr:homocysteine S-methyltransferase YbgG-like [Macrosteles quadrilineatus]XP_054284084.1 homocysteine S-methyltransferase YbgG-like [Macrosteles quadrilineatus]